MDLRRVMVATVMALAVLAEPPLDADSWAGAQIKEVFSASREWFVRVTPGTSIGETVGFAGSPKGKHATAEFYRRASGSLVSTHQRDDPAKPGRQRPEVRG